MMAHGIIAVSIITALMPRMSAAAADGRFADVAADLSRGTRMVTAVLAPIAVCYAVLAAPIAVALFRYGAFTAENAPATSTVLLVAALGAGAVRDQPALHLRLLRAAGHARPRR